MDNIVDYLIVLFFIISFLSSVFRKKKKQAEKEGKIKRLASSSRIKVFNPV